MKTSDDVEELYNKVVSPEFKEYLLMIRQNRKEYIRTYMKKYIKKNKKNE